MTFCNVVLLFHCRDCRGGRARDSSKNLRDSRDSETVG